MSVTAVQGNGMDFHRRALERVAAIPGVQGAAFAWGVPLTGNDWPGSVDIEGQPLPTKPSDRIAVPLRSVTPGYFQLLGQSITLGRDFRATDVRDATDVAVVNQALADRYFPQGNAIGKKIWGQGRDRPAVEIVGVVTNGRTDDLTQGAEPEVYLCFWQASAFSKEPGAADGRGSAGGDGGRSARVACRRADRRCGKSARRSTRFATIRWPRGRSPCNCWSDLRWSAAF